MLATLGPAALADAATVSAKPGGLGAALTAAGSGGTVQLTAGTYADRVTVPAFTSDVKVVAAPGAAPILRNVVLQGGRNLHLEGLRIQGIRVTGTDDLTIANSEMTASGAWFFFTDGLELVGNRIHDAYDGVVIDDATDWTFARNECWAVPVATRPSHGDCLQTARTARFAITDNVFRDMPAKEHVDAIEITDGNTDGLIARNVFRNVRGLIMGPGTQFPTRMQTRMTIVNNLFARTRSFSIQIQRLQDSKVLHNTAPDAGMVSIAGASYRNVVVGNIIRAFKVDVTRVKTVLALEDHNILSTVPSGYRRGPHSLTGTATFVNPTAFDYHLKAGSKGIGAGSSAWVPADDLLGVRRVGADLGALEFPG
jgi:hypothetical protein